MSTAPELCDELFVPPLAAALRQADTAGRERLLKAALVESIAALPPIIHEFAADASLTPAELADARALADYRLLLMDGSSRPMGLPYDWYYGVADGHEGPAAPRFIQPRIAFSGLLARAYRHTGDATFARALRDYVMDYVSRYWLTGPELPARDNWLCTSCRGGTWYDPRFAGFQAALVRLGTLAPFSGDDLLAIYRALHHMMTGLIPHLALGSNWRVHQLSNLFTQGLCYPFLRQAAAWRELAANGLNEEFVVQFRDDGSHEESCLEYGAGTWQVFAHYYVLAVQAPATGLHFPAERMARVLEYYLSAAKPFGLPALIGDAYEPRTAAMLDGVSPPHPADHPPAWGRYLRLAAGLLGRAADWPAARFVTAGTPSPAWGSRHHPCSGYLFLRDGWQPHALYASLNLGYYANCHCHYGLLGLELAGLGREFVVDPGCSALDSRPINQNFARTRAHSTLCVDGLDQQIVAPAQPSRLYLGERYDFVVGLYRGGYTIGNPYGPGCTSAGRYDSAFSGSHFRHLLFVHGGYWVLFDALTTRPGHVAETRLQFLPNPMAALPGGGYATGWPAANLALLPLHWEGWDHALLSGQEEPIEGWLPGTGGALVPAPVYRATQPTGAGPLWHGSLLYPYPGATPPLTLTALPTGGAGFAYRLTGPGFTDYLFLSNSWQPRPIVLDDIATDTACLHLRLQEGRVTQAFACEGSYLTVAGRDFYHAPGTMLAREFRGTTLAHTANPRYPLR